MKQNLALLQCTIPRCSEQMEFIKHDSPHVCQRFPTAPTAVLSLWESNLPGRNSLCLYFLPSCFLKGFYSAEYREKTDRWETGTTLAASRESVNKEREACPLLKVHCFQELFQSPGGKPPIQVYWMQKRDTWDESCHWQGVALYSGVSCPKTASQPPFHTDTTFQMNTLAESVFHLFPRITTRLYNQMLVGYWRDLSSSHRYTWPRVQGSQAAPSLRAAEGAAQGMAVRQEQLSDLHQHRQGHSFEVQIPTPALRTWSSAHGAQGSA